MFGIESEQEALKQAADWLASYDRILIGAGAGLSSAAGLLYSGPRFTENFQPFIKRFGMTDMYSAGFYPFPNHKARWAYWAKHVEMNRLQPDATPLYQAIVEALKDKDYFIITTNVDAQFQKAGADYARIFATQGDYAYMQCSKGCHDKIYSLEELAPKMVKKTLNCEIPEELVPHCPVCGGQMAMHLRCDNYFVQTVEWYKTQDAYQNFVAGIHDGNTLLIEFGVGWNTPVWIRYPFEQISRMLNCPMIRMNYDDARVVSPNAIGIQGDIADLWPLIVKGANLNEANEETGNSKEKK